VCAEDDPASVAHQARWAKEDIHLRRDQTQKSFTVFDADMVAEQGYVGDGVGVRTCGILFAAPPLRPLLSLSPVSFRFVCVFCSRFLLFVLVLRSRCGCA
jgi:hypothetical protein